MACRPTRWPKRDAYPVSVFRWNAHWLRSFLRNTQRKKFMPHSCARPGVGHKLLPLVLAEHPAEEVYAPHLVARLGEPQLGERDPHLHDPAQRIDRRRYIPHGVPGPIPDEEVVTANVVLLHPGGIYRELKRRAVVVVAVKVHVKHVTP